MKNLILTALCASFLLLTACDLKAPTTPQDAVAQLKSAEASAKQKVDAANQSLDKAKEAVTALKEGAEDSEKKTRDAVISTSELVTDVMLTLREGLAEVGEAVQNSQESKNK